MMTLLYREMKMTSDLQSFEEPDFIKGEMQLVEREDGAYVIWLEYDTRGMKFSPIVNEA